MLTSFIFSYFLLSSLYICRERSTNPPLFIQNKPNFKNDQINVNKVLERVYGNVCLHRHPKRTQNEPNSKPISPKTKPIQTQFKSKRSADPYGQASRNPQTGDPISIPKTLLIVYNWGKTKKKLATNN